ncbi:MAG: hypothetical protein QM689_02680 [Oscillospiraceae bacterium]
MKQFEDNGDWESARQLLYALWQLDKSNIDLLNRLIAECWLVMSDWDCCINTDGLEYSNFQSNLIEATAYGLNHFYENIWFLCLTGYMISLFPHFFYEDNNDGLYLFWEDNGKSMLKRSYDISQDDLTNILYLGSTDKIIKYKSKKKDFVLKCEAYFQGDTAIELYFRDVLLINID